MNVKTKLNKIENIYGIDIYKLVKEINKYIRNTYHTKKIYVELDESDTTLNLMNDKTMKYYTLKYWNVGYGNCVFDTMELEKYL